MAGKKHRSEMTNALLLMSKEDRWRVFVKVLRMMKRGVSIKGQRCKKGKWT